VSTNRGIDNIVCFDVEINGAIDSGLSLKLGSKKYCGKQWDYYSQAVVHDLLLVLVALWDQVSCQLQRI